MDVKYALTVLNSARKGLVDRLESDAYYTGHGVTGITMLKGKIQHDLDGVEYAMDILQREESSDE